MKLNEILKTYKDIIIQYKDASDLEKAILALRNNSYSYAEIQKALGNPSKKFIRQVLLKYDPELIDIDTNFHKLAKQKRISIEEGEFRYRLIQTNIWKWNLQGEDYEFYIKDNELFMKDSFGNEDKFSDWDESTQKQFLNELLRRINENRYGNL